MNRYQSHDPLSSVLDHAGHLNWLKTNKQTNKKHSNKEQSRWHERTAVCGSTVENEHDSPSSYALTRKQR